MNGCISDLSQRLLDVFAFHVKFIFRRIEILGDNLLHINKRLGIASVRW